MEYWPKCSEWSSASSMSRPALCVARHSVSTSLSVGWPASGSAAQSAESIFSHAWVICEKVRYFIQYLSVLICLKELTHLIVTNDWNTESKIYLPQKPKVIVEYNAQTTSCWWSHLPEACESNTKPTAYWWLHLTHEFYTIILKFNLKLMSSIPQGHTLEKSCFWGKKSQQINIRNIQLIIVSLLGQ